MYLNLAYIVLPKIHEKYHQYLRLVSPKWKKISFPLFMISDNFINMDKYNLITIFNKLFANQNLISAMLLIKMFFADNFEEKVLNRYDCIEINDKILLKILIGIGANINIYMLQKYSKDLRTFILNCLLNAKV